MRVISQNGEFDFPYEQIVVQGNENIVFARLVADSKARNTLGKYETPEKAEKAMEMLQKAYEDSCKIEAYIPGETPYMMVNNLVFRFPQDSEVEV